jgi:topoisomerase-4 subunit A
MILRELKAHPHRIVYMGNGENRQLRLQNQKGEEQLISTDSYAINDRTSNGSFVMDEKQGGEVTSVIEMTEPSITNDETVV